MQSNIHVRKILDKPVSGVAGVKELIQALNSALVTLLAKGFEPMTFWTWTKARSLLLHTHSSNISFLVLTLFKCDNNVYCHNIVAINKARSYKKCFLGMSTCFGLLITEKIISSNIFKI